jgi:hypothetical protein
MEAVKEAPRTKEKKKLTLALLQRWWKKKNAPFDRFAQF